MSSTKYLKLLNGISKIAAVITLCGRKIEVQRRTQEIFPKRAICLIAGKLDKYFITDSKPCF
jgi:hypothetical protein